LRGELASLQRTPEKHLTTKDDRPNALGKSPLPCFTPLRKYALFLFPISKLFLLRYLKEENNILSHLFPPTDEQYQVISPLKKN